jgi:dTDP-glucose pyrophosphorylase
MKNWKNILVNESKTVIEAIKVIDSSPARVALVVNSEMTLVGTITDGDVRRGILRGVSLDASVNHILNNHPVTAETGKDLAYYEAELSRHKILQLPLVDNSNRLTGLHISSELRFETAKKNPVVLMAGGLGTRLGDLTTECPKPMLKVGGKPILETIISNFKAEGFENFYLAVNFKSEVIEKYFKDGSDFGVKIQYLRENRRMGTAGSLSLIKEKHSLPLIVMNGDLLTSISINEMLKFHQEAGTKATACIREYGIQIPFGVVETSGTSMKKITEKPTQKFYINAGVYVIEPDVLDRIPQSEFFDMPSLLNALVEDGKKVTVFPIREYWLDIGRKEDFERAHLEYGEIFE